MTRYAIPTLGYGSRYEAAAALRRKGLSPTRIAEKIGCNVGTVYRLLAYAQTKPSRRSRERSPVLISLKVLDDLRPEAKRRGMSANELSRRLLKAICEDNLVAAVLDDREGLEALQEAAE